MSKGRAIYLDYPKREGGKSTKWFGRIEMVDLGIISRLGTISGSRSFRGLYRPLQGKIEIVWHCVLLAGFLIAIIKAKSTAIVFFSSPPFLLLALSFLLSFSFVTVTPFTQMTANFVRLVVKKSNRLTQIKIFVLSLSQKHLSFA